MVDLNQDLAYESLSENSSKVTGSNHLSTSSLSGSSQTHGSSNSYRCSNCNKKLAKQKALRQNAIESDDYISDPLDSKLPGSQITLTPDVALMNDRPPILMLDLSSNNPVSSTSSISNSYKKLYCKHCMNSRNKNEVNKRDKFSNGNPSHRRDSGIFNIIKTTFYKLFDLKSKSPTKAKIENSNASRNLKQASPRLPRKRSSGSNGAGGYVSINSGHSEIVTTPGSSIIYDSLSADSGRQNDISSRSCSTRNSIYSLGTLSVTTTNDLIQSSENQEFTMGIRNEKLYSDYIQTELDYDRLNRRNPRVFGNQALSHACLLPTHSCPPKSKSLSSQYSRTNRGLLCSSWPPSGRRIYYSDKEDFMNNCDDDFILERVDRCMQSRNRYEFNIPFGDIRLGDCVKSGNKRKVYRGHWHGDVSIFMFENLDHDERSRFWENVSNLTMIRHENIVLFMGASIEPPHFLMVTSACNGPSLYEKIHMSREKMRQSFKVNLMRQIAQAVGYLHAKSKPIIVKRLNSRNIYLEPKVVLSLLDCSQLDFDEIDTLDNVYIPSHLVWYAAPELLELGGKDLPKIVPEKYFVQATDVYSFGMLIYEIHIGRYPNTKNEINEYIADTCAGKRPDIKEMRASETVKNIIRECWSHDHLARPEFSDISRELMKRDTTRKRHSSSVPGNLHQDNSLICNY